jgi:hypothetical protein
MQYEFDHLVIMARDQMSLVAKQFSDLGFHLSAKSTHNLGSSNQLIVLDNTYLEILGWKAGTLPQRQEIANQALGLDALVFRTTNAEECFKALQVAGLEPNAVQDLSRPAQVDNEIKQAFFKTVRFSQQPITGLRIYFCEHLTPDFVWVSADQQHLNSMNHLQSITLESANPLATTLTLIKLLQIEGGDRLSGDLSEEGKAYQLHLNNCDLKIVFNQAISSAQIASCSIVQQGLPTELQISQAMLTASHQ